MKEFNKKVLKEVLYIDYPDINQTGYVQHHIENVKGTNEHNTTIHTLRLYKTKEDLQHENNEDTAIMTLTLKEQTGTKNVISENCQSNTVTPYELTQAFIGTALAMVMEDA